VSKVVIDVWQKITNLKCVATFRYLRNVARQDVAVSGTQVLQGGVASFVVNRRLNAFYNFAVEICLLTDKKIIFRSAKRFTHRAAFKFDTLTELNGV
jgi:hypothetical protein